MARTDEATGSPAGIEDVNVGPGTEDAAAEHLTDESAYIPVCLGDDARL